jgi:hypothetical protein
LPSENACGVGVKYRQTSQLSVTSAYWTEDGTKVQDDLTRVPKTRLTISRRDGGDPGSDITVCLENPNPASPMMIANFGIYVDQDPDLVAEGNLAYFYEAPLQGAPAGGIPTEFTLDVNNPAVEFTTATHPTLDQPFGRLAVVQFDFDDIDNKTFRVADVPEPASLALLALGALGAVRRHRVRHA